MSTASAGPASILSLPTGGGALHGIGESFRADPHTGSGTFTVPITVPRGRNGFQPDLSLGYATGNGNGFFGLGWRLGTAGVRRKTSHGVPRYDGTDTYLLSGAEDLVPVDAATSAYRPRTEGAFARIRRHRTPSHDYWEVRGRDGLTTYYGTNPAAAPAYPAGWDVTGDMAATVRPGTGRDVFAWEPTLTTDPFGNRIEYLYLRDGAQPMLGEIRYADHGSGFLIRVTFDYEDRPDPFSDHRAGFEIRTSRRCRAITVRIDADEVRRSRRMLFGYTADPLNRVSLLTEVTVEGFDETDEPVGELPPLAFGYTGFAPLRRTLVRVTGADPPPLAVGGPACEQVDLTGGGLPDVLQMDGHVVRYWRNLGGGRFDRPREMARAPGGLALADPGVQLIDADGDGRTDLLVTRDGLAGYFPMRFGGGWDRRSFRRFAVAPTFRLDDPDVKLVDLDGDGRTDAIRSGTRMDCAFNDADPAKAWRRTRSVARRSPDAFPDVAFSDPRVRCADMTGDGLQDIVLVHDRNVEYWPNQGHGEWGRRVHMTGGPRLPYRYDPARLLLGDVDGDGLADLVYVDDCRVLVWVNQSGNGWSEPVEIPGTPAVSTTRSLRLTDLLGTGVAGVLWGNDDRSYFLDLTGGVKPYLLSRMDNRIGATLEVSYRSSAAEFLRDSDRRDTRWHTPLPFPVQVVSRVVSTDHLSDNRTSTEYAYHHGYWDGVEREFRGFGMVEQRDISTAAAPHRSPPTLTRTWFHQGPVGDEDGTWADPDRSGEHWPGDPDRLGGRGGVDAFLAGLPDRHARRDALRSLRGAVLRTEVYGLDGSGRDGRPYTVTEHAYAMRAETTDASVLFPHLVAQRTTQWERGDDPMTTVTFLDGHDAYGQPGVRTTVAVPRGRRYTEEIPAGDPAPQPYLVTRTVTDYARRDDATLYAVDRVCRSTTFEIPHDGRPSLTVLKGRIDAGPAPAVPVAQTVSFYDGAAYTGLPIGTLGAFGALVRSESLVLTEAIVQDVYGGTLPGDPWPAGYPPAFVVAAGYTFRAGDAVYARGWFATTLRRRYDFQLAAAGARGMLESTLDARGNPTGIGYDVAYGILPVSVTDAAGLITKAGYDFRTLRPREISDPNGMTVRYAYTPLGLLARTWTRDRTGTTGDVTAPGVTLTYDFGAYVRAGQPISVRTTRRMHHDSETTLPPDVRNRAVEVVEYSDAFGRVLQTRQQDAEIRFGGAEFGGEVLPTGQSDPATADPVAGRATPAGRGPHVVVNGWQRYDDKGRVVERYEPFLGLGWAYAPPAERELGAKVSMEYDALGRVTRTVRADGSELRAVHGVPAALDTPDDFAPTPWETYTYDANDLAPLTGHAAGAPASHHYTPAGAEVDALGRTIRVTTRDATATQVVRAAYDVRGNLVSVTDALGRTAFSYVYDLADRAVRIDALDGGTRRMLFDAAGNPIERIDGKGAVLLRSFDALNRPVRLWARDDTAGAFALRERIVYGDDPASGLTPAAVAAGHLLGRIYRHFDGAGRLTFAYDFKGNPAERARDVIDRSTLATALITGGTGAPRFVVDWDAPPSLGGDYRTTFTYDALNRFTTLRYPAAVDGVRRTLAVVRNGAGALEGVTLDGVACVDRIAYDARGRRVLVVYGNGVLTRHAYDPETFRLVRLRTEHSTKPAPLTYLGTGDSLQDLGYGYDLAGNVVAIHDRTGQGALDRIFTYDALYRLRSATGRESETYDYDACGNLTRLRHDPYDRVFTLVPGTNRIDQVIDDGVAYAHGYDANGNLVSESTHRALAWDFADRLAGFAYRTAAGGAPATQCVYLYGAGGERVVRYSRDDQGQEEVTVIVDGVFEHHLSAAATGNTLHVMDSGGRVATVRVGDPLPGDGAPAARVRYQLGDHLGGAHVIVGGASLGDSLPIDREEYTPYGETSFGGFARKRFRFTGKERGQEDDLYYYGARYYSPWTARWVSCDPDALVIEKPRAAPRAPVSGYLYAAANPLAFVDRDGNAARSFYVTLPYERFRDQDTGGYLRNTGAYAEQLAAKGTGYEHISAKSLDDMVEQINSKLAPGDTVKNLVIATHGTRSGSFFLPSQEGTYQSAETLKTAARRLGPTLADLQQRMPGANVTLHACEVGNSKYALEDVGRFFGAKGGWVSGPKPFVQFYRYDDDGKIVIRLDQDMTPGGEWSLDSEKGRKSMTRVEIKGDPMSTKPDVPAGPPRGRTDAGDPTLRKTENPSEFTFDGYDPDNLIDPSRNRDAGRYRP